MAKPTSLLSKLRTHFILRPQNAAVLSFDLSSLLSHLLVLHHRLSLLPHHHPPLPGVLKLVSGDPSFLLSLSRAELLHSLKLSLSPASRAAARAADPILRSFPSLFHDFVATGRDPHGWVQSGKELHALIRRADRLVGATAALYREMEELAALEKTQKNAAGAAEEVAGEVREKIIWQRQQVKYAKERSLWVRSFDSISLLVSKLIFTALARIKLVFGIGGGYIAALPRCLSASAATGKHPLKKEKHPLHNSDSNSDLSRIRSESETFFETNTKALIPPETTLGGAALAVHYANLIIVLEKMVKTPHLIGLEARDDLYRMLPSSVRAMLRMRLKGVGFNATDPSLASEWREALGRILGWLAPLAHNMMKWEKERSLEEKRRLTMAEMKGSKGNVMLVETLYFADREKAEAAIVEVLVGLNYVWRFEREMNARALFGFHDFNAR